MHLIFHSSFHFLEFFLIHLSKKVEVNMSLLNTDQSQHYMIHIMLQFPRHSVQNERLM